MYYLREPPLREEELPPERDAPPDIPPDERMVLDDDERIVLDEEERTAELLERAGVLDERTAEDERDGVVEEQATQQTKLEKKWIRGEL